MKKDSNWIGRLIITILCLTMLTVMVFAAGCRVAQTTTNENFAVVTDQIGREVVIPSAPQRLVSLSPSNTETAFALGLGSSMVGVTDYCNYPEEALKISKVGGFSNPNVEAVLALEPDLVFAGNMHEEQVKKLEELNIPVLVLSPESIEDVFEVMVMMGSQ
jgi:iron complex transport system substrate-binding protein